MSAAGTVYVNDVIAVLSQITQANGYRTNAGLSVQRGRPEQLSADQLPTLPAILVSTDASEIIEAKPGAVQKERRLGIVTVVDASAADYEPLIDDLDDDVTRALLALVKPAGLSNGALAVTLSGGDYQHPEPGSNFAYVRFSITQRHIIRL